MWIRLSAGAYFGWVTLTTVALLTLIAIVRPAFGHSVMELLGLAKEQQAAPDSFYSDRVAPLFAEYCVSCHGEKKQKGKLRLDTYAHVLRGSKNGSIVDPRQTDQGELISRLLLPPSDPKAMPPEGKKPLSNSEITIIKLWIAAGASATQRPDRFKNAPPPVKKVVFPKYDPVAVQAARSELEAMVKELQMQYPGAISYESRNSAFLQINASIFGPDFKDADLEALRPLFDKILIADLSNTRITDASSQALASMAHLRSLRLQNTRTTAATVNAIIGLKSLESLGLDAAHANDADLTTLRAKGVRIYNGGW